MLKLHKLIFALALAAGVSTPSAAQPKAPPSAYVPLGHSKRVLKLVARQIAKKLRAQLEHTPGLQLTDTAPKANDPKPSPKLAAALQTLEAAASQLRQGHYRKSLKPLKRILPTLLAHWQQLKSPSTITRCQLLLARTYYQLGYTDNGDDVLTAVISRDPLATLGKSAPTAMTAALRRIRLLAARLPKGTLKIVGANGSHVTINGRRRGTAPLTLRLAPGAHVIGLSGAGHHRWRTRITITATGTTTIHPQPAPVASNFAETVRAFERARDLGQFDGEFQKRGQQLAQQIGASFVLTGLIWKAGGSYRVSGFVFDAATGEALNLGSVRITVDFTTLDSGLQTIAGRYLQAIRSKANRRILTKRPAFYALAGVVPSTTSPPQPPPVAVTPPLKPVVVPKPIATHTPPKPQRPRRITPAPKASVIVRPPAPPHVQRTTPTPAPSTSKLTRQVPDEDIPLVDRNRTLSHSRNRTPRHDGGTSRRPRWYKSWWFWTVVGVVVVGATTGTVVYFAKRGGGASNRFAAVATW